MTKRISPFGGTMGFIAASMFILATVGQGAGDQILLSFCMGLGCLSLALALGFLFASMA